MEQILRLNDFDFIGGFQFCSVFSITKNIDTDSTGINFFISHLMGLIAIQKPENINEFCEKYFIKISSCQHVIGSDYAFISGCKHNRRAFVFCLHEVLVSFSVVDEFAVAEFQQIVEQLCPDFPSGIAEDCCRLIDAVNNSSKPAKYSLRSVLLAFSFQFLFMEWLKEFDKLYTSELRDVTKGLHPSRVRNITEGIARSFPLSLDQPHGHIVESVLTAFHGNDIGRDDFKRSLLDHSNMVLLLSKIKYMAPSLTASITSTTEEVASARQSAGNSELG